LLFLVGFMGAGKTSAGQELARRLHWEFVDLDQMIQQRQQRTVAEIFASEGEGAFREYEAAVLNDVLAASSKPRVVALGGGAFSQPENFRRIRESQARVAWLETPASTLWERCRHQTGAPLRPLLQNESDFRRLLETRLADYRRADVVINTANRSVSQVVAALVEWLGSQNLLPAKEAL
jgi:shikimate kinase